MWKTGITDGYKWEAKVDEEPSEYGIGGHGINGRRVSQLYVISPEGAEVYSYDRGLDINKISSYLLDRIIFHATN